MGVNKTKIQYYPFSEKEGFAVMTGPRKTNKNNREGQSFQTEIPAQEKIQMDAFFLPTT